MDEQHLADIAEQIGETRLEDLVASTVTQARELPGYESAVPYEELRADIGELLAGMVRALREGCGVDRATLDSVARTARRRARQDVPIGSLIGACHIGGRELWSMLIAVAGADSDRLTRAASVMFSSLNEISRALAGAHAEATRARLGHHATLSQRFVELAIGGDASPEVDSLAEALGFIQDGKFLVAASRERRHGDANRNPDAPRHHPAASRGLAVGSIEGVLYFISQGISAERLSELSAPTGFVGIGLRREGLAGVRASALDARMALRAATDAHPVAAVDRDWLMAALLSQADRVAPLLGEAADIARDHPHLISTVVTFACNGMSVTRTAQAGHLHPNTVRYRLERWHSLTGIDPLKIDGLSLSLIAGGNRVLPVGEE